MNVLDWKVMKEYLQRGDDNDRKAGGSCIMMEFVLFYHVLKFG